MRFRRRGTKERPTSAPTPEPPRASPYHQSAACSRRRPNASRNTKKPAIPRRIEFAVRPRSTSGWGGPSTKDLCSASQSSESLSFFSLGSLSRKPAMALAKKTTPAKINTPGEPTVLSKMMPGIETTKPASVPSRVSCAFHPASP